MRDVDRAGDREAVHAAGHARDEADRDHVRAREIEQVGREVREAVDLAARRREELPPRALVQILVVEELEHFRLVLDLGNGAVGALQQYAGLADIDAICLSHLHADHCIDMLGYSVDDAAAILDTSPGTVKSRCARGRARLLPYVAHLRGNRPASERVSPAQGNDP